MDHYTYYFDKMPIRLLWHEGEYRFVIRDICNILGFSNPNRELAKHIEKPPVYAQLKTNGGHQVVRLVTEDDVRCLLRAKRGRKAAKLQRFLKELMCSFMEIAQFMQECNITCCCCKCGDGECK